MATFEFISSTMGLKRRKGGSTVDGQSDEENNLFVAQGLPANTEVARRGDLWSVQTATPFAGITAVPTTLAKLEISNNSADRYMIVKDIWSWQLLGTAVVWSHTPWAQVGATVFSANTALVFYDAIGGAYTSAAAGPMRTAVDQTVVANGWRVFPGSTMNFGLAAATPGGANVGQVDGQLIVPPKLSLHIAVSSSVNTASALHCGASFVMSSSLTSR